MTLLTFFINIFLFFLVNYFYDVACIKNQLTTGS